MGVRGLQSYIKKSCKNAYKEVPIQRLADLADEHRRTYKCEPEIAVDGMCLANHLYKNSSLEWVYGGQWMEFVEKLKMFIASFCNIKVKLVFFFDGTVCTAKRHGWVQRRLERSEQITEIFEMLKKTPTEPDKKKYFKLPTSLASLAAHALKELGMEVHLTDRDNDAFIAGYAKENEKVFAILSTDSDFIIYDTKKYLSLSDLKPDFTTIHYDRECFAKHLCLSVSQLPIFALLCGNDSFSYDDLRQFHRDLTDKNITMHTIAGNIAKLIKRRRWSGKHTDLDEIKDIAERVFGKLQIEEFVPRIKDGLESYSVTYDQSGPGLCPDVDPEFALDAYEKQISCSLSYVYNIINKREYESSEVMEETSFPSSILAYRHIRQRCYGVLFNSFVEAAATASRNQTPVKVQEWCTYHGNLMKEPELIEPLALWPVSEEGTSTVPVFSIEDLWFKCTESQKMQTFRGIMGLPMDVALLETLPSKDLIGFCCILNYHISNTDIDSNASNQRYKLKPLEVAVFIAQALRWKTSKYLRSVKAPRVDIHAVNLSTLFLKGVLTVMLALSVCNCPLPLRCTMPWRSFDGKLFHHMYVKAKKKKPTISELCKDEVRGQNEKCIEEFYQVLLAVTSNTDYAVDQFDWESVLTDFKLNLEEEETT